MAHGPRAGRHEDDQVVSDNLTEDEVRIRGRHEAPNSGPAGRLAHSGVLQKKVEQGVQTRLDALRLSGRVHADVGENMLQFIGGLVCVLRSQRSYFAQMDRTWSSVVKSPRTAAACEPARAASSSAVRATGGFLVDP